MEILLSEKQVILDKIEYLKGEINSPDTPESMLSELEQELAQTYVDLDAKLLEIKEEELRLQSRAQRLSELKNELDLLTKNNSYYIKAFGHAPRWRLGLQNLCCIDCPDMLEIEVAKLRQAKLDLEAEQAAEKVAKLAKEEETKNKLAALGLSIEDLRSLL